ncbi:unnamed protein product [Bursaphelenchus okinawaensis]|uniref:C2 domain-containing protein n=1 Tax=Bursaphelenchus okinawaensis TaxID=465554 RepID=A0A811JTY5_9BILA|nr:unnamed protein product [Bursaphelenchus okinawaensis]CAG9082436.1 unnamed protein product [Bursaphelenchus okinawaensis]
MPLSVADCSVETLEMRQSLLEGCIRAVVHHPDVDNYSNRFRLLEHIRQIIKYDEESFEMVVKKEETSIEYCIDVEIQTSGDKVREFMLQLERCDGGSCATSNKTIRTNEKLSITLRHGQKSIMKVATVPSEVQAKEHRSHVFRRLFEKNTVVATIKTKHMKIDQENSFKLASDAILKCKLKKNYDYGDRLVLSDLTCLISMLSNSLTSEDLFETTVLVLRLVCDFYSIEWSTCELLLVDRLLHIELDDKDNNSSQYCNNASEVIAERPQILQNVAANLINRVQNFLAETSDSAFFSLQMDLNTVSSVLQFFKPITKALTYLDQPKVRQSIAAQLHTKLNSSLHLNDVMNAAPDITVLIQIINRLTFNLRKFKIAYSKLFNFFNVVYTDVIDKRVARTILSQVDNHLNRSLKTLDSRDDQQLKVFTKSTMQLFATLRQLSNFLKNESGNTVLEDFEKHFYTCCIFWTHGWRGLYLGFIKKCVEDSRNLEDELPVNPFQINDYARHNVDIEESAVLCLAFCKAFCDDVVSLEIQDDGISLLCYLQAISILADSVVIYGTKLHQQALSQRLTYFDLTKAANGIEHACDHLISNFERFLNLKNLIVRLNPDEKTQIIGSVQKLLRVTEKRCKDLSGDLIKNMCIHKYEPLRRQCEQITSTEKKIIRHGDPTESLLTLVERLCTCLKGTLLPRLYYVAVDLMWKDVIGTIEESLKDGQTNSYYDVIYKSCEAVAELLSVDWKRNRTDCLRSTLFMNKTSTVDLILQYCVNLCDITTNTPIKGNVPFVTVKLGYIQTTNRHILLQVEVVSGSNLPVLDGLSKSSDPYLRVELYPHCLYNVKDFPAYTTATRYKTLNPVWNESCQFLIREDMFFLHGSSLCISMLDQDVFSHNDLGGQAFYPLAAIPRVQPSDPLKQYQVPLVLPLKQQFNSQFEILKQRHRRDKMAKEFVDYEMYISSYRMLPTSAVDEKEFSLTKWIQKRKRIRNMMKGFI